MHTATNWRPWSPATDWGKGCALRFLRLLVAKSEWALPVVRFFAPNEPHAFHDEQWVDSTDTTALRSMDHVLQISSDWERVDPPVRRLDQGPLELLVFRDGSGLALRKHPRSPGVYALPTLPFVGDPTGVDPHLLWQPCLNRYAGEPPSDLQPYERLLPTPGGMASARKLALPKLAEAASLIRGLFPGMPSPIALYGGAGNAGPYYHHQEPENLGHLTHVVDAMTRLARLHLPGRLGFQQSWNKEAAWNADPRVPTLIVCHPTFGGHFNSAHHKMSAMELFAQPHPKMDSLA
jgi:hypothetical protein